MYVTSGRCKKYLLFNIWLDLDKVSEKCTYIGFKMVKKKNSNSKNEAKYGL